MAQAKSRDLPLFLTRPGSGWGDRGAEWSRGLLQRNAAKRRIWVLMSTYAPFAAASTNSKLSNLIEYRLCSVHLSF
jgi:hypothetical protein